MMLTRPQRYKAKHSKQSQDLGFQGQDKANFGLKIKAKAKAEAETYQQ